MRDAHSARDRATQTPRESLSRVGAHSSKLDPIQEIGPKVESGHSFVSLSKVCIAKMVVVHCA